MNRNKTNPLEAWTDVLQGALRESTAHPVGLFHISGELLFANAGMKILLGLDSGEHAPSDYMVNPGFADLVNRPQRGGPVFEGVFTMGNGFDVSRSIRGEAHRKNDRLLILGEYDVLEMDAMNRRMADLNREISNLQRRLIREKKTLARTLDDLRETQSLLVHAEKMNALGQMVAGVAHELNSPIGYVRINLRNVKDAFEDIRKAYTELETAAVRNGGVGMRAEAEAIREAHDIDFLFEDMDDLHRASYDGLSRIRKIVRDLRVFSRLDEGEVKEVDIGESIESALAIAAMEFKERDVAVRLDLGDLPAVHCHAAELNQVFLNLMLNAAQAMENGGALEIRGTAEKGGVRLEFIDTGVGIPEEIIDRIFDPFFTTKPVGRGTGLGLSLAWKIIVEKHKGSIDVRSRESQGTVFTIFIPGELSK